MAAAVGTLFVTVSFWALAYGLAVSVAGTRADPESGNAVAGAGIALALLVVPPAFAAVALISRRPDYPLAILSAMGLSIAFGLPLLVFGNPLASLLAGYAAGAVVTMSRPPGRTWPPRAVAAAVVMVVALLGMLVAFFLVALLAPALPFTAPLVADAVVARREVASGVEVG